jgi:hypothetical protein
MAGEVDDVASLGLEPDVGEFGGLIEEDARVREAFPEGLDFGGDGGQVRCAAADECGLVEGSGGAGGVESENSGARGVGDLVVVDEVTVVGVAEGVEGKAVKDAVRNDCETCRAVEGSGWEEVSKRLDEKGVQLAQDASAGGGEACFVANRDGVAHLATL